MAYRYPLNIELVRESFARLPGIGKKTAERLAVSMLNWDDKHIQEFAQQLLALQDIKHCKICGNLSDEDICDICSNTLRNPALLCVVETVQQIPAIENTGKYTGYYHVLGGRLSPLDGIEPEDLSIDKLLSRVEQGKIKEIILATNPDVEGEATASYIANLLSNYTVDLTRISRGIPLGADLSYADAATMGVAMDARRKMD